MPGMKLDKNKPEYDRLVFEALAQFNAVHIYGNDKYEIDNWKQGIEARRLVNATFRHLSAILHGELIDPESGLLHSAHAGVNCEMLTYYFLHPQEYSVYYENLIGGQRNESN